MRILIKQFLSQRHSWSCVGWGLAKALKNDYNQEIDLFATDGNCQQHLPKDLLPNLIGYTELNKPKVFGKTPDNNYDMSISYTCMKNFPLQLKHSKKNRFGIWLFEWNGKNALPNGFAKYYKYCDKFCVPSEFGKQVFLNSGIPDQSMVVIPHGIHSEDFRGTSAIKFKTNKKFKLLANFAQIHIRKNIIGLLEAYGKAFTKEDDVCLIIKAKDKQITSQFEISLKDSLNKFYEDFPQHADIEIYSEFVPDISALYRSIDAVYSLSHCEGFYMVGLEALAAGKLNIYPNYGGGLDFLNSHNSLLVYGKESLANPKSIYWEARPGATWFNPNIDDAVDKLRYAFQNYENINKKIKEQQKNILQEYDWKNIAAKFLALCK